jgi:hypothetical protein
MKYLYILLFIFCFENIYSQGISIQDLINQEIESGKAYGAFYINDTLETQDSFYLEIIAPEFEMKQLTIKELYDLGRVLIDEKSDKIVVKVRPAHLRVDIITNDAKSAHQTVDFAFAFYERMVFHRWFEWDSTKNENGQATFGWTTVMPVQFLKQQSQVRLVDKATAQRSLHPIYAFAKKYVRWSEITLGCRINYSISQIQTKLIEQGYDCPLNNILDQATKQAVIQFQKDNHLPIGRLDHETLTLLGID